MGKAREQEIPQRRVYKHASERIGVRIALRAFKPCVATIRSGRVPQGTGSAWMKRRVDGPEARRKTIRRKASWVVPPFSPGRDTVSQRLVEAGGPLHGGERWNDPGQAGESDLARYRGRARRQLPVGLEPTRWCPRTTKDVRGRDDFDEGSSSRRKRRPSAGGQHPERREALPRHERKGAVPGDLRERWGEGASRSDRPKRA